MKQFVKALRTDWLLRAALMWTLLLAGGMVFILIAK